MASIAPRRRVPPDGHGGLSPPRLVLVGANHRTSPLDVRERLVRRVTWDRLRACGGESPPWEDVVLLSTCNRVETYALTRTPRVAEAALRRSFGPLPGKGHLYVLRGADAARHLVRVAAGLDSLAQGETQIADQVRRAPRRQDGTRSAGGPLGPLFERAAHVAPRVRALAGFGLVPASASQAAVRFVLETVPLSHPTILLLGSGKMARLAARAFRGRASLLLADRNPSKARAIADELQGTAKDLQSMEELLAQADAVVAATSTAEPLVTARTLRRVLRMRRGRPMWLVDLGVPRNIDPRSREIEGVSLLDIDGLEPWALRLPSPAALARAEARIQEEAAAFIENLRTRERDEIAGLRRAAEALRRREVERALARLPGATDAERAVIEKLTSRLVNQILHGPTQRLRDLQAHGKEAIVRSVLESWHDLGRPDR